MRQFSFNAHVTIDADIFDLCVELSQDLIQDIHTYLSLSHRMSSSIVPLRITGSSNFDVRFVGCRLTRRSNYSSPSLFIGPRFSKDLSITDGEYLNCSLLMDTPRAVCVIVAPSTESDSEVVELNAESLEKTLLRHLQIVQPGMSYTIPLGVEREGLYATIKIKEVRANKDKHVLSDDSCAQMSEGTEWHVALIASSRFKECTSGFKTITPSQRPCSGFFRSIHFDEISHDDVVYVTDATLKKYGWSQGMECGILPLSLWENDDNPCKDIDSLKNFAFRAILNGFDTEFEQKWELIDNLVYLGAKSEHKELFSNLIYLYPSPLPVAVLSRPISMWQKIHFRLTKSTASMMRSCVLDFDRLKKVHSQLPTILLKEISLCLLQSSPSIGGLQPSQIAPHFLLFGAKGVGKTTVALSVAAKLKSSFHISYLICHSRREFLAELRQAFWMCHSNAPSILILDNFECIAPAQEEGRVSTVSSATETILEVLIKMTSRWPGVPGAYKSNCGVIIIAIAKSRERIHKGLTDGAALFSHVHTVESLSFSTREACLIQELKDVLSPHFVHYIASLTHNFTPFDIKHLSCRILNSIKPHESRIMIQSKIDYLLKKFQPLMHTGVPLLKQPTHRMMNNIGGLHDAKKAIYDTILLPIKHPHLFSKLPLKTRNCVLLYGPSGCGKSYLMETLSAAENIRCIVIQGPEIFGKYIGESERKIRECFEEAQAASPCIIFIDEFESIALQRGQDNTGVTDRVVNQLLCYLDGVESRKDVYVVAASSRPDLIDSALLRPGRLDKKIFCPVPSLSDRREVLQVHLNHLPFHQITEMEIAHLSELTENWTCADLGAIVSTANLKVGKRIIHQRSVLCKEKHEQEKYDENNDFSNDFIIFKDAEAEVSDIKKELIQLISSQKDSGKQVVNPFVSSTPVLFDDLMDALSETRKSLSETELLRQKNLYERFQGHSFASSRKDTDEIGKKLTLQ